ncbi:MAG: hypothetical protein ACXADA_14100 [Candidatus Hodarchaeales archaeon]
MGDDFGVKMLFDTINDFKDNYGDYGYDYEEFISILKTCIKMLGEIPSPIPSMRSSFYTAGNTMLLA